MDERCRKITQCSNNTGLGHLPFALEHEQIRLYTSPLSVSDIHLRAVEGEELRRHGGVCASVDMTTKVIRKLVKKPYLFIEVYG